MFYREGCTVELFTCWQVRVIYAPEKPFNANLSAVQDLADHEWIDLTRFDILENQVMHVFHFIWRPINLLQEK